MKNISKDKLKKYERSFNQNENKVITNAVTKNGFFKSCENYDEIRNARYEFFDEILEKTNSNKIAIAHNKNDKVETIIMNMLRGSGIAGLKGIEPIKNNKYIRPLIECERYEIENYCKEKNIEARIDRTNFENVYTRNKIRNIIIPYIKNEFNPNIIQTMDRLSELVKEEDEYLEKLVEQKYQEMLLEEKTKEIVMDLKKFNKEEKVIKSRILLYTIARLLGSTKGIEKIHIEDVIKMCSNNIGNKYLTPNKNIKRPGDQCHPGNRASIYKNPSFRHKNM